MTALLAVLVTCAVTLAVSVHLPALGLVGICVLGISVMVASRHSMARRVLWQKWRLPVAWAGTLLVPCGLMTKQLFTVDTYYSFLGWTMALGIALAGFDTPSDSVGKGWKILALAWAFASSLLWLAIAYSENSPGAFYLGLLINTALLVLCRVWFRLGSLGIQATHTLILLLVGLPIVDLFFRPPHRFATRPDLAKKYYQFETAKKDPAAYARWWRFYLGECWRLEDELFDRNVDIYALRTRPNSEGTFFDSRITINSRGFRGKEFSAEKDGVYRIVALGESTTFGITMTAEDKPWPELLEELIRQRLRPARPVEVINAGVPTYALGHSLHRLPSDILPLKPDMIISYHGFNGFPMLYRTIPPEHQLEPPAYRLRPIKLLADCEYRFKLRQFERHQVAKPVYQKPSVTELLESNCALAYEALIAAARTNHIRLALANFSMAVNQTSQPDVVQFYRVPFPIVHWQIRLNAAQSIIIRELTRRHPEVCFVDTHPNLDGEHDKFVDLIHLTRDGREQLAENMFAGIRECLLEELSGAIEPAESSQTGSLK